MIDERENKNNAWKQALERRQTERLSSNFSYRMMENIRQEAEKQRTRKAAMGWIALIASSLALLGIGSYFLFFYMDIRFTDYLPVVDVQQDSFLFKFYGSLGVLALALLGLDYWLRRKYIWK